MKILDIKNIKIPSINNKYYKNFSLTKEYREFKELVYYNAMLVKIPSPYTITIIAETYVDVTNFEKPILDALEAKGIINNDKNVLDLLIHKIPIKRGKTGSLCVDVSTKNT